RTQWMFSQRSRTSSSSACARASRPTCTRASSRRASSSATCRCGRRTRAASACRSARRPRTTGSSPPSSTRFPRRRARDAALVQLTTTAARPTLLIDASSLAYRAYHAMPPVHASDGTLVNAVASSPECEAADVIATLTQRFDGPIEVVSGDRDLFTLVRDPRITVLYTLRGVSELAHVDQAWVKAKYA